MLWGLGGGRGGGRWRGGCSGGRLEGRFLCGWEGVSKGGFVVGGWGKVFYV